MPLEVRETVATVLGKKLSEHFVISAGQAGSCLAQLLARNKTAYMYP